MSHFAIMVIGDDVEKQLQPYHEYECTGTEDEYVVFVPAEEDINKEYEEHKGDYSCVEEFAEDCYGYRLRNGVWGRKTNPNSKWDWWVVGGRWSGFLKLKSGHSSKELLGQPGLMGSCCDRSEGRADTCKKRMIDFEGMRDDAEKKALETWQKYEEAVSEEDRNWKSWEVVCKEIDDIKEARKVYHDQPAIVSLKKAFDHFMFKKDQFLTTKEEYIQSARDGATSLYAFVKDSKWVAKGDMGWWGMSSNEEDKAEWDRKFNEMLDNLPDDTEITIIDCHI